MTTTSDILFGKSARARDEIRCWIREGLFKAGEQMPSERELARKLGLNPRTVRRGLEELVLDGTIIKRPRVGNFVASPPERTSSATRIALAFPSYMLQVDNEHPVIGAYLAGSLQRCTIPEFTVQSMFYEDNLEDIIPVLIENQIDGLVLLGEAVRPEDYDFLKKEGVAVVHVSGTPRHDDWTMSLYLDHLNGLTQAVEHLRALGHSRISFICYRLSSAKDILKGHFAELAFDHRLGNPKELIILVENVGCQPHWADVESFFDLDPVPTGVVVADEYLADIFLDGCDRRGITVPDDVSVVALQDARPLGHRLPLTALATPETLRRMASEACELLVAQIAGKPVQKLDMILRERLKQKASTGPAKPRS